MKPFIRTYMINPIHVLFVFLCFYYATNAMENGKENYESVVQALLQPENIHYLQNVLQWQRELAVKMTCATNGANAASVKMTFATNGASAALLDNSDVVVWGDENVGGCIPVEIRPKLKNNVRMIYSTNGAFAALLNDEDVVAWGDENFGGKISKEKQDKLRNNVKMIVSNNGAFAALLNNGDVVAWGDENFGGHIPDEERNNMQKIMNETGVITIIPKEDSFLAFLSDGRQFEWGGKPVGPLKCSNCTKDVPEEANVCSNCGLKQ